MMDPRDIRQFNREAWNRLVAEGNRWTVPVTPEEIARARKGDWSVVLTPTRPVPRSWFPPLEGADVLCLASGGGQQGPLFAAAGARVTVLDNSPRQLAQDRAVAEREGLAIETVEGDMRDLGAFGDSRFDLVFHPCSNVFVDAIVPVWKEAFRVLRPGGTLLAGISNPVQFLFDPQREKEGAFQLRFPMPYSDLHSLTAEERERYYPNEPLTFAHSLEDQIGGQLDAGFHLIGFFEDDWGGKEKIDRYLKVFIATRAVKPR